MSSMSANLRATVSVERYSCIFLSASASKSAILSFGPATAAPTLSKNFPKRPILVIHVFTVYNRPPALNCFFKSDCLASYLIPQSLEHPRLNIIASHTHGDMLNRSKFVSRGRCFSGHANIIPQRCLAYQLLLRRKRVDVAADSAVRTARNNAEVIFCLRVYGTKKA